MSLEQYKDASRKELWEILQIQSQLLQEEIAKNAELKELSELTGAQYNISRAAFMSQEAMLRKRIAELKVNNQ